MAMTVADAPTRAHGRRSPVLLFLRRIPATLTTTAILLIVGVVSHGLWEPFRHSAGMDAWAYGLPAFEAGRWWTAFTGTFLVAVPWAYVLALAGMVAMGALEYLGGTRAALGYFCIGQLFAVCGAALLLTALRLFTHWAWAQETAAALSVGPSAGAVACLAAVLGLLPPPWRTRGWMILLPIVIVAVLVLGRVTDLERVLAVGMVLVVDRTFRPRRATVREQRLVAFVGMITYVSIEVLLAVIPTDGPFGRTEPLESPAGSTALDVIVVLLIANGLRRARRWAWVTALVLLALNVVFAAVLMALIPFRVALDLDDVLTDGTFALDIGTGFLSLMLMIYLVIVRGAFARRRHTLLGGDATEPTSEDARALLHRVGGGTLSWMTTWDGNDYLRTDTGIVAFQRRADAAIALGDPLGPEHGRAESVTRFIDAAEHAGLAPCFFNAGESTRAAVPPTWRSLVVADDTIVDLPGLAFTGKRFNSVRTTLNRAQREDVTFRLTRLVDEPWGIRTQLNAISEEWVGDKDLPEMRFTLGTLAEAADPEVRIALAIDARGSVDGFLSWLPMYGRDGAVHGWTLDLMRRREDGFGPVMEYLIGMSALAFRDEGAQIMSLSGAPLAHEYPPEARVIAGLSTRLADALEPVYGFQSLHRFKAKFHPRYETMYLLFRDEADLARIGAGLTRAFLPDATTRQFARAGLELVRGGD